MITYNKQEKRPELYDKDIAIGFFIETKSGWKFCSIEDCDLVIDFDQCLEISEFLAAGEYSWLFDQVMEVANDWDWWERENDSFEGKTPNEQYEEDPSVLYNMLFRLQTGMPG